MVELSRLPQIPRPVTGIFTFRSSEALYSLQVRQSQGNNFRKGLSGMSSKKEKMSTISLRTSGSSCTGAAAKPQAAVNVSSISGTNSRTLSL